ncbi:hypothetical protein L9G74_03505 [Shewanella sp. C32]|uniref:Uncharacterized protein n=1 Tax=Shewanella electrica TaxID=515560 RepID=A0ABT2FIK7_9GAMM|nr:hypothetical protein [Shewanella electrica]MCH1923398.1 hypothetical protein [Shewanella electrica]MCS4555495.1 hypothetical protein [Shewanella electrica]
MKSSRFILGVLTLVPFITSAHAATSNGHTQAGGLLASIVIMMLVGGYTLLNIPLQALFYFNGQYQSARCVTWHSAIGIVVALIGAGVAIYDQRTMAEMTFYLGLVLVAIALASLPFLIKSSAKAPSDNAGFYLLAGAVCYMMLAVAFSPLIAPFAIGLALIAGHWHTNTRLFSAVRWLLVLVSIGWFIYQLSEIYQQILTNH